MMINLEASKNNKHNEDKMNNQQQIKSQSPSTKSFKIKNLNSAMKNTHTEQKIVRFVDNNATTVKDIITSK